ncbi:hypothetical protein L6164_037401 [Bauhinia variegata]|uniref:Uncharacterized protein n=1 Tax=Bauhinia variegata TaxID=167791 RepID=A0ACB9KJV7_BAUVA|nr:hypothetical protein L6164_037401 [Bauhinia variegata]
MILLKFFEAIESLDLKRQCSEYWNREKGSVSSGSASDVDKFTNVKERHLFQEMKAVLQGFLKKASPDKLSTMHELFISNMQNVQCREMFLKLIEEMQKNM